jgi:AI-2 transport protein TqsA
MGLTSATVVRNGALFGAAFVIIVAGLRAAAPILAPFALALFVVSVTLPLMRWLRSRGAPTPLAILLIVVAVALFLAFFGWVVVQTVAELRVELPGYLDRAEALVASAEARLRDFNVETPPDFYQNVAAPERLLEVLTATARYVTSAASLSLLLLLYLVFLLAESLTLPVRLRGVFGAQAGGVQGGAKIVAEVQRYLVLKTLISLATGVLIGGGAAVLGVDFAMFWGLLAFVLNFVPTVGSVIAAVPAIIVALLQLGPAYAVGMTAISMAVNITIGNFVDPIVIGRQLRLSPLVILVSLVFWTWVWGPIGAFLTLPLTITVRIACENIESLRPLATLMGPGTHVPADVAEAARRRTGEHVTVAP